MRLFIHLLVLNILVTELSAFYYLAKAWQSRQRDVSKTEFPEVSFLKGKPNTAISFSGGGSRSYSASLGVLSALHQLDLLKNVRYVGGASGGGWATIAYTYAQNISDEVLLGPITNPEDLSNDNLKGIDPNCARGFSSRPFNTYEAYAYFSGKAKSLGEAWCYAVSQTYLEPAGIQPAKRFSWNKETVADILSRNPSLQESDFQIPLDPNRPFPIIGMTVVGPFEGVPYSPEQQNYTWMDVTPLYVGQFAVQNINYFYNDSIHSQTVGGAIEPFAFTVKGKAPLKGLGENEISGTLSVPQPDISFDLQYAAGTGSFALGPFWDSIIHPIDRFSLGFRFDYWSPILSEPQSVDMLYGDGGNIQDLPLITLLQRKVEKLIIFSFTSIPLAPSDRYNPYTDSYTGSEVTDDFTCYFGVWNNNQSDFENRTYEFEQNQVFATADYPYVVSMLQKAQAEGNGIFASFNLTTIENSWWGIPAGMTVEISFFLLGRLINWEAKLSSEMYTLLVPTSNTSDLSHSVEEGPYEGFPFYATEGAGLTIEQANVLADLTGWSILQNAEAFRRILS